MWDFNDDIKAKRDEIRDQTYTGVHRDIEFIYNKYKEGKLNLQPKYQRNAVWTPYEREDLIESILNFDLIGTILINEREDGVWDVIDGQQRLTTVFMFIENKFKTNPNITKGKPFNFEDIKNAELLHHQFITYPFIINILKNYSDEQASKLFLKINTQRNMARGEKIHAIQNELIMNNFYNWANHDLFKKVKTENNRYQRYTHFLEIFHSEVIRHTKTLVFEEFLPEAGGNDHRILNLVFQYGTEHQIPKPITDRIEKNLDCIYEIFDGHYDILKNSVGSFKLCYYFFSNLNSLKIVKSTIPPKKKICQFFNNFLTRTEMIYEKYKKCEKDPKCNKSFNKQQLLLKDFRSNRRVSVGVIRLILSDFMKRFPDLLFLDNKRSFSHNQRLAIYDKCNGKCQGNGCKNKNYHLNFDDCEFHHIKPYAKGGPTTVSNGVILCHSCHSEKHI